MKLLDLFCGAGGSAMGYWHAGFNEIVGIDHKPQPNYPFAFTQADALEYAAKYAHNFDMVNASPPCQRYSKATAPDRKEDYPDLIDPTRDVLQASGVPYVIENVPGAPLDAVIMLCGTFFNLKVYRHRYFETSFLIMMPWRHRPHNDKNRKCTNKISEKGFITVTGGVSPIEYARKAMGIEHWMARHELVQAIPPAYTRFIGTTFLNTL